MGYYILWHVTAYLAALIILLVSVPPDHVWTAFDTAVTLVVFGLCRMLAKMLSGEIDHD